MNVKRFVGKNIREAMAQVRAAYGDEAVLLSNRAIPGGIEILAMPNADVPVHRETASRAETSAEPMSTLSFQDFVRERARKRAAEAGEESANAPVPSMRTGAMPTTGPDIDAAPASRRIAGGAPAKAALPRATGMAPLEPGNFAATELAAELAAMRRAQAGFGAPHGGMAAGEGNPSDLMAPPNPGRAKAFVEVAEASGSDTQLLAELKSMRGMIASQLSAISWFDNVRRSATQTRLLRLLIANGFSPALARHFVSHVPSDYSDTQANDWLAGVLTKNLKCVSDADSIVERGGVYALMGPTGVGKTTTTAKMAAQFAVKHGAASLGLITVDTYRMAASDQLRAFGRILNIPVHTAHDSASLLDMLNLFSNKKLVLIDTVGVGQRDRRLSDLFSALPTQKISRLLVINAAAQAETLEEVVQAYRAGPDSGVVISKLDEAVKTGPVVDLAIRHRLKVLGIANGQRVPEDWHSARAHLLVQRALMDRPSTVFSFDDSELSLMLSAAASTTGPVARSSTGAARA